MTAVALLSDLSAAGLTLALEPPDTLLLRGDPSERARFAPRVRALKADLVSVLGEPRRLWLIVHPDGSRASHAFTPAATLAEVAAWYPGCDVAPEEPPGVDPASRVDDADLAAVRGWLARIGETDRGIIEETLSRCQTDPAALLFFVAQARGAQRPGGQP